jgi:acyl transferase domain-containing protein
VARARRSEPTIPFLSNLTGDWITPAQATDPAYWADHLRGAVRFADCAGRLLARGRTVLIEIGPGRTLQTLARLHPECTRDHVVLASTRQPRRRTDDRAVLLAALAEAWAAGVAVDWAAFGES